MFMREEKVTRPDKLLQERTDEIINELKARLCVREPLRVLDNRHRLFLLLAFVVWVVLQVSKAGLVSALETGLANFGMILSVVVLDLLTFLNFSRPISPDLETCLSTAFIVIQDYAILITLNRKYIETTIIPFTILAFIGALASKAIKCQSGELRTSTSMPYLFIQNATMTYFIQLHLVVWKCTGLVEQDNIFIFSSFLLFLGSALCALTVLIASSPFGSFDGVDQVLPVMHKTCIVMFMLTAHSMAAEWLWEDIVFACMLELISILAWFTIYYHHPEQVVIINSARSHGSQVIILSTFGAILACLASLYTDDRIGLRSWFVRVFCISSTSSVLSYVDVWLLDQWPGSTPNSSAGLVQLLKFSSLISSCLSACIAAALFQSLVSNIYQSMLQYSWTMLAMLGSSLVLWLSEIRMHREADERGWY